MRRHPFLLATSLIFVGGFLFFFLVYSLSFYGEGRSFSREGKVGVVTVNGVINDSLNIVQQLDELSEEDNVKAVVLRINSPGGDVAASQEIYEGVVQLKRNKKIIVSMGSEAASGGYLIACGADKIVANAGTITGSISAIMFFANAEELLKKIGLKSSVVKSGKFKDIGSPVREMTKEEKLLIQGLINDIYDQFLDVVSQARNISKEELKRIADGRVFSGRQAKQLGLVDYVGDMAFAIHLAAKMAGIKGKPKVFYPREKEFIFWKYILRETLSILSQGLTEKELGLSSPAMTIRYQYYR
jgi:protease-4